MSAAEEVTSDMLEKEREILQGPPERSPPASPKPWWSRIVERQDGKILRGKSAFIEQHYIKDESQTIGEMVMPAIAKLGENISIKRFSRFKVGEVTGNEPADIILVAAGLSRCSFLFSNAPENPGRFVSGFAAPRLSVDAA